MARMWICCVFVGLAFGLSASLSPSFAGTRYSDWELWTSPATATLPKRVGAKGPFSVNVAGGMVVAPKYFGSGSHELKPLPLLDVNYAGKLFLSNQQGVGWNAIRKHNIRAGPRITFDLGRQAADDPLLVGLPNIDFGTEMGLFFESYLGSLRFRGDIRQEIGGGHGGFLMSGEVAWGKPWSKNASIILGLRGTYMDDSYAESYFSVAAANVRSGLSPARIQYTAQGGLRDFNGYFQIVYNFTQELYLAGEFRGTFLMEQAANSPLTDVEHPFLTELDGFITGAFLVGYRF